MRRCLLPLLLLLVGCVDIVTSPYNRPPVIADMDTVIPEHRPDTFLVKITDDNDALEDLTIICFNPLWPHNRRCRYLGAGLFEIRRGLTRAGVTFPQLVTATDTDGLGSMQVWDIRVNHAPGYIGPDTLLLPKDTGYILHTRFLFKDPDDDSLNVTVRGEGIRVTGPVRDHLGESYELTWEAGEDEGLVLLEGMDPWDRVTDTMVVRTPPNLPPVWEEVDSQFVDRGSVITVDLKDHVSDLDGEITAIAAVPSDGSVSVSVSPEGVAEITGEAATSGSVEVTAVARDDRGASSEETFPVVVTIAGNRIPEWSDLPLVTVSVDQSVSVDLADYSMDHDGKIESYRAWRVTGHVRVSVSGSVLKITGASEGKSRVLLRATDDDGDHAYTYVDVDIEG
ncbi:MAG: hypothetical protein OXK74_12975 [Gemmatimonadota bacterium]|nr:hypothetical protein [Gemmatimonadota bacterium]